MIFSSVARRSLKAAAVSAVPLAVLVATAAPASAHPLGNFTVNHYNGITVRADRIDDLAIVDSAEIPTLQAGQTRDTTPAGVLRSCRDVADHVQLRVDGRPTVWNITSDTFQLLPGAAGLPTSRLTCVLTARRTGGTRFTLADRQDSDRIGWHEITAAAAGIELADSTVPQRTVSDELRHYPNDLLASPLNVRDASFSVGHTTGAQPAGPAGFVVDRAGPATRALQQLNSTVDHLIGVRRLTIGVVVLAIALAALLGASHAALPGHGKTVMAAYLAGRGGGIRDAVTVGVTVTATHTAGVIILGFLLSASTRLAGESLLAWLGVVSGLLIVAIGAGLLRAAWRGRTRTPHDHGHRHHEHHPHAHAHAHSHSHTHSHDHGRGSGHEEKRQDSEGGRHHFASVRAGRRRTLIGMGVAGGLVPSPSALVVLLGAVALGRTALGVVLVLSYGLGMAATLTAAGLLLLHLRDRIVPAQHHRFAETTGWLTRHMPLATAALVLTVGLGLAWRSLPATI